MVSNILNRHPRVLSLSEFYSYIGIGTFRPRRPTGDWMWDRFSKQQHRTRLMLREPVPELIYPFGSPDARFTRSDVPPIMCAALPHITDEHEALFDELEPVVRGQPRQSPADHLRYLFGWLCERFDRSVWVERSGGSLLYASRLLRVFPEMRVIHVYRDGRETTISMSRHYLFRLILATLQKMQFGGFDAMALLYRRRLWEAINPYMEPLSRMVTKPEDLPFDKLTLPGFAVLWSALIELGDHMVGDLPPDRLLNLKFEDMQAEPEAEIRRLIRFIDPSLEDDDWIREASTIPRPTLSKFAQLDPSEQAAITEACRPGLEILGYSL